MVGKVPPETMGYKTKITLSCIGTLIMREAPNHKTTQAFVSFLAFKNKTIKKTPRYKSYC